MTAHDTTWLPPFFVRQVELGWACGTIFVRGSALSEQVAS